MKHSILYLTLFFFSLGCIAQRGDTSYKQGIQNLSQGHYIDALNNFERAATSYKTIGNKIGYSKAALKLAKIKIESKNFEVASKTIEDLIQYYQLNQLKHDSLWVEIHNAKALNLKFLGEFKKALTVNDFLLENTKLALQFTDRIYHLRSRIEVDLGDYDKAINSAKKALDGYKTKKDSLSQAAIYNIIGVGLYFQGKYDSTLVYYDKSLRLKKQMNASYDEIAISTFNIGIVYEAKADYDKAFLYYKEAEKYDLLDGGETTGVLTDIYVAMINSYYSIGDYGNAELYARKALQLANKVYGDESTFSSFVYASYSSILEIKSQYREANRYIKKALDIRKKTYGETHQWTFESHLTLASNYLQLKEIDSAEVNLLEALRIAKKSKSKVSLCYAKKHLGELYTQKGEYEEALKLYINAEILSSEVYGQNHDLTLDIQRLLANCYFLMGDLEKAKKSINQFKNLYTQNKGALIEPFIPEILNLDNRIYKLSLDDYSQEEYEEHIMSNILLQISIIKKIRNRYSNKVSKIFVGKMLDEVIANAIGLCFEVYGKSNNDIFLETAFKLSELNRNNILLEGIQDIQFKRIAGIPKHILDTENDLIQKLEQLGKEIHFVENDESRKLTKLDSLRSEQLVLNAQLEDYLFELEQKYPKYYSLKYDKESVSISKLQDEILKPNQTFLEYYVGEKDTYLFAIEKSFVKVAKIAKTEELKKNVIALRNKIIAREDVHEESKKVFELLFNTVKLKEELIIVTDNFLNDIPFEILRSNSGQIVAQHGISYVGSANLLSLQKNNFPISDYSLAWCGFAPEFESSNTLSYASDEVEKIAKIMNGKVFSGKSATLKNFKEQIQNTSVLHLATHTALDNINPTYNKLLFSNAVATNQLTTSEIYTLQMNAELAVLGACNTGYGKFERGEGVMNMARAFQYAGVGSTVMSLWKVPDKQTSTIMVSFYTNLKDGLTKNKALQKAKIDYLNSTEDPLLKHPYYWAGFIISGNVNPIENRHYYSKWWWLLLILTIIITGFYSRKQKLV